MLRVDFKFELELFQPSRVHAFNGVMAADFSSFVFLQTGETPEDDYVILRERISTQRRDVERALTRFVARTGESHPLLPDDKNAFPCKLTISRPSFLIAMRIYDCR